MHKRKSTLPKKYAAKPAVKPTIETDDPDRELTAKEADAYRRELSSGINAVKAVMGALIKTPPTKE